MDKATRNAIERATQQARKLLDEDFSSQLEGTFDVLRTGVIASEGGAHLSARQLFQRGKIVAAIEHKRAAATTAAEAVTDYVRDAAFTTFNRFVALKMLEARELVQECITRGEQSAGFKEFCGLAPGVGLLPDAAGYRLYIESLFDEFSTEIKVLFDRRDAASVLWPKRQTFEALLTDLNAADLSAVWSEDETIGWVYQFFNSGEERKKMRDESQAPRNSRELAVRNQFFTPRYVVQFLVDNTLGRMWMEMHGEGSALVKLCEYLVRADEEVEQPRTRKDPRDLRVLDPACGSGHFLLYSFDLLLAIYEEAWAVADGSAPTSEATGRSLKDDYPDLADLRRAIPGLVVEHNLHGVDIDARCAQIAALGLWLRAQRAWKELGIGASRRPRITRTHIVVAEPMPGDVALVNEFADRLDPPLLRGLFKKMVSESHLAGELGTLLRIDDGIATELKSAREQFVSLRYRPAFLPGMEPAQEQSSLDLSGIDDDHFFHEAETRIVEALRLFAEAAPTAASVRRRLFSGDAAQGVALVDLLRMRFDVVLMNPPFGDPTPATKEVLKRDYKAGPNNLYAAFVLRGLELLNSSGLLGCITSRTGFFVYSLSDWRQLIYRRGLPIFADLGEGVMDGAMVEAAAYCIGGHQNSIALRCLVGEGKETQLRSMVRQLATGDLPKNCFRPDVLALNRLALAPFAYWTDQSIIEKLERYASFEPKFGHVRKGLRTGDNFRFVRAYWEVAPSKVFRDGTDAETADGWVPLVMSGASQPWHSPIYLVINWLNSGRELRAYVLKYGSESRLIQAKDFYFKPGFSWTHRATRMIPYITPPGCIFTGGRPMAFARPEIDPRLIVGIYASRFASAFLRLYGEKFLWPKFPEGNLKLLPIPELTTAAKALIAEEVEKKADDARKIYSHYEPFLEFVEPRFEFSVGGDQTLSFNLRDLLSSEAEGSLEDAYGLTGEEANRFAIDLDEALYLANNQGSIDLDEEEVESLDDSVVLTDSNSERAFRLISYALGCVFGRWNPAGVRERGEVRSRSSTNGKALNFLSASSTERENVQSVQSPRPDPSSDILPLDPGHRDDISRRTLDVLDALGVDRNELLKNLGVQSGELGAKFWKEFWVWHISVYSLGRRKAPIYWQLATPSSRYSIWLHIHDLNKDTFFRVQMDYAGTKLIHEQRQLEIQRNLARADPSPALRKAVEAQEDFVEELQAFFDAVKQVAPLWNPDLDDGVVVNFAPLWRLVPHNKPWQKELRKTWDVLSNGGYDWAHLAMHLWPERVVPKCATDRSLAIAHGLEAVFWVEGDDGKWKPRPTPARPVAELVHERTSVAVKAALEGLAEASVPSGPKTRTRRSA